MVLHERSKQRSIFARRLQGVDAVIEIADAARRGLEGLCDPVVSIEWSVSCLHTGQGVSHTMGS